MAKRSSPSSKRPWLVPALIAGIVVVAALIAYFFGDQIATFIRYRGSSTPGSAAVLAITCIDQNEDGSCNGDTGRVAEVQLQLTEQSGTVSNQVTDANGTARFSPVSYGNHEMLVTLPFPGRVTVPNPILVSVPAPTSANDVGFEVQVFVPIALTGESQFSLDLSYLDPTIPGALLKEDPLSVDRAYTFYPGQAIGVRIDVGANQALKDRTRLSLISDFDDACVEAATEMRPVTGRADDTKVRWDVDTLKPGKFNRSFSYAMRLDVALPEISPLICTDRVTILSSTGATLATTTRSYQIVPLPTDRAVLEMGKSVADDNAGAVKAGDTLTYTLAITNIGQVDEISANLMDDMPALVEEPKLISAPNPKQVEVSSTGGKNGTGFIKVTGLQVPVTSQVGEQVTISFSVKVKADVKQFERIDNYVTLKGKDGAYVEARKVIKVGQAINFVEAKR
ncbi:MAG: isopeptide-forming domain-containing fimbrial protein [Parcubacteria group bacterium]